MPAERIQEQAHTLFEYIKEVCQLNQQKVLDVSKQEGVVYLQNLDDPTCVTIASRDRVAGAEGYADECLFSFRKPDYTACPLTEEELKKWLVPGWEDFKKSAEHLKKIEPKLENEQGEGNTQKALASGESEEEPADVQPEYFADDPSRVEQFKEWTEKRKSWVEHEQHTERLRGTLKSSMTCTTFAVNLRISSRL